MKRPVKIKLDVVKTIPAGLVFVDSLFGSRGSVYVAKLTEALGCGGVVQITVGDAYVKSQLAQAAKKMKVKLVFAVQGEYVYIKPVAVEGEQRRLLLLLREPRTLAELDGKKLELNLGNSLAQFVKDGIAHEVKGKWVLTERGMDAL